MAHELLGLRTRLAALLDTLISEGLLDERFRALAVEHPPNRHSLRREILFCLRDNKINVDVIKSLVGHPHHTLRSEPLFSRSCAVQYSCTWMGVWRMRAIAVQLGQYSHQRNRQGCVQTADRLKQKFIYLKIKLQTVLLLLDRMRNYEHIVEV